ncbi:MAG: ribosome biogenesis GTP-binding protein YihA/YsxC [Candidatus Korobacteraceae bacterium]|jgi:GTP-binding protein
MKVLTKFLLSAYAPEQFPLAELPEIAFLGRSNVGKSSLINSLVSAKIAKTSNTPGRTQAINFFEIRWPGRPRPELIFADLPGYGYARVPREISRTWPEFIEPYLAERPTLSLCLCLVDANIPPQPSDTHMISYLRRIHRPLLVVATKADRVGSRVQASLNALKQAHGSEFVLPYSAKSGLGRDELWKRLRSIGSAATASGEIA